MAPNHQNINPQDRVKGRGTFILADLCGIANSEETIARISEAGKTDWLVHCTTDISLASQFPYFLTEEKISECPPKVIFGHRRPKTPSSGNRLFSPRLKKFIRLNL
jgi:hypothetical protein